MSAATAAIVGAESILALTPIVIKRTAVDPITTVWSRVLSSAVLGFLLTSSTDRELRTIDEWAPATILGYINLLHITTSYESFRHLPAGQAMSILYTYPFWNLVFGAVFREGDEPFTARAFESMAAASVGAILLNLDPSIVASQTVETPIPNRAWGIFMALLMTLTESAMFTLTKSIGWSNPAKTIWISNTSAALWLGALNVLAEIADPQTQTQTQTQASLSWDVGLITVFHTVSLFSGYWLRNYAITRISTIQYSILSYAGLLASYVFGLVFVGEKPGWMSVLGAAIIITSGLYLNLG